MSLINFSPFRTDIQTCFEGFWMTSLIGQLNNLLSHRRAGQLFKHGDTFSINFLQKAAIDLHSVKKRAWGRCWKTCPTLSVRLRSSSDQFCHIQSPQVHSEVSVGFYEIYCYIMEVTIISSAQHKTNPYNSRKQTSCWCAEQDCHCHKISV